MRHAIVFLIDKIRYFFAHVYSIMIMLMIVSYLFLLVFYTSIESQ